MTARGGARAPTRERWGRWAAARLGGAILLALVAAPAPAAPGQVAAAEATGWQMTPLETAQRIVVDLTKPIEFKVFRLSDPDRVVVDMPEIDWRRLDHAAPLQGGWVTRVRYGVLRPGISRLVVDATQPLRVRSAVVTEPRDGVPSRLILDLEPEGGLPPAPVIASAPRPLVALAPPPSPIAPPPAAPEAPRRSVAAVEAPGSSSLLPSLAPSAMAGPLPAPPAVLGRAAVVVPIRPAPTKPSHREPPKRVIVVDAGHGGVDPGAISLGGVYEKTVTLAVAEQIERQLDASGRYKVVMTRSDDTFVRLRERVAIARQANAELFISIHADSLSNHAIGGMSIYTLSETASDREAEALAAKENKADIIAGVDLRDESPQVSTILIDLAQRETKNLSAKLAHAVIDEIGHDRPLLPRPHRFAGFAVLTAPDVPSILIELGYLSNHTDERELLDPGHRQRFARAIERAVDRFFAAQGRLRRS